jgi:tetratricopeptide (TPR) repeat protein
VARSWALIGLAAAAALSGCASAPPPGPRMSPTGIVYEAGTPPTETRYSQTATLFLRQDRPERALEIALEGVEADPGNPIHYFLAGVAAARIQRYELADSMFRDAQRIYPAYELEVEPEREAAWGAAFNAGLERYGEGDIEGAIAKWRDATIVFDLRPEAHRNLGSLLASEGRYEEAIAVYRAGLAGLERPFGTRVPTPQELEERARAASDIEAALAELFMLTERFAEAEPLLRRQLERDPENFDLRADLAAAVAGQGREAEASELYAALLSEEGLAGAELFELGVGLFRAAEYRQAADAFGRLARLQPWSRDAWFNYANSLFAAGAWEELAAQGARLLELDPLGENARLITARAQLELGDRESALRSLQALDAVPAFLDGLRMQRSERETTVSGRIVAQAADPGTPLSLAFTFYDAGGRLLGTQSLSTIVPPADAPMSFQVRFPGTAAGYRYEVLD